MSPLLYEIDKSLPNGFQVLLEDSIKDGHQFLERLQNEWISGANRFDQPGERLLGAVEMGVLAGLGGINIDPYLKDHSIGRIRHLYIHTAFRRNGLATRILKALEADARHNFGALTLRTSNPHADLFYQASDFGKVEDHPLITHQKVLR